MWLLALALFRCVEGLSLDVGSCESLGAYIMIWGFYMSLMVI